MGIRTILSCKYAESSDGINWIRTGQVALDFSDSIEAIGNLCY